MKALVSPNEIRKTGYRIAEVSLNGFDVSSPLFWIDCADDVVADQFWYDPSDQSIKSLEDSEEQPYSEEQP